VCGDKRVTWWIPLLLLLNHLQLPTIRQRSLHLLLIHLQLRSVFRLRALCGRSTLGISFSRVSTLRGEASLAAYAAARLALVAFSGRTVSVSCHIHHWVVVLQRLLSLTNPLLRVSHVR
jgi:hypothetical protein